MKKDKGIDHDQERERYEALIRNSPLNADPTVSPRQHRIGQLAAELIKTTDPAKREELLQHMFVINEHATRAAEERRSKQAEDAANSKRAPRPEGLQRCMDILDRIRAGDQP